MVAIHLYFRRTTVIGFVFSSLFFFVSCWAFCVVCPSCDFVVVSVGCYINIAGRKPVSRESRLYVPYDFVQVLLSHMFWPFRPTYTHVSSNKKA